MRNVWESTKHRKLYEIQPNSYRSITIITSSYFLKLRQAERITRNTIWELTLSTGCFYICRVSGHKTASGYAKRMRKLCAQYAKMKSVPLQPPGKRICLLVSRLYQFGLDLQPAIRNRQGSTPVDFRPSRKQSWEFEVPKEGVLIGRVSQTRNLVDSDPHKANLLDLDPD